MKKKLLIATTNPGKLKEISGFLSHLPIQFVSLKDVGITDDVEEDGKTYEENAEKKAHFYAEKSGLPSLSDDGGIEIAALNNAPGIHSKRWLGDDATEEDLIQHMQKVAIKLPDNNRDARFVVALSLVLPNGQAFTVKEMIKGIVPKKPYLNALAGYPYRSFFYIPQIKKYYFETELTDSEQKQYNHRYKALEKIVPIIKKELGL